VGSRFCCCFSNRYLFQDRLLGTREKLGNFGGKEERGKDKGKNRDADLKIQS
jgi:hypothetical protein